MSGMVHTCGTCGQDYGTQHELEDRLAEYERLHAELNAALHPDGGGPAAPSLCDLVAYARADHARIKRLEAQLDLVLADARRYALGHTDEARDAL